MTQANQFDPEQLLAAAANGPLTKHQIIFFLEHAQHLPFSNTHMAIQPLNGVFIYPRCIFNLFEDGHAYPPSQRAQRQIANQIFLTGRVTSSVIEAKGDQEAAVVHHIRFWYVHRPNKFFYHYYFVPA